jgi:hypothetical protein
VPGESDLMRSAKRRTKSIGVLKKSTDYCEVSLIAMPLACMIKLIYLK